MLLTWLSCSLPAQLQEKRAVKRGEIDHPLTGYTSGGVRKLTNRQPVAGSGRSGKESLGAAAQRTKLVSKFLPLTPEVRLLFAPLARSPLALS